MASEPKKRPDTRPGQVDQGGKTSGKSPGRCAQNRRSRVAATAPQDGCPERPPCCTAQSTAGQSVWPAAFFSVTVSPRGCCPPDCHSASSGACVQAQTGPGDLGMARQLRALVLHPDLAAARRPECSCVRPGSRPRTPWAARRCPVAPPPVAQGTPPAGPGQETLGQGHAPVLAPTPAAAAARRDRWAGGVNLCRPGA